MFNPAPSTKQIFGGRDPAEVFPALANKQHQRKIVMAEKVKKQPLGTSIAGTVPGIPFIFVRVIMTLSSRTLLARQLEDEANLPSEQRYIRAIFTGYGLEIVVTLLPGLVQALHKRLSHLPGLRVAGSTQIKVHDPISRNKYLVVEYYIVSSFYIPHK